MMSSQMISTVHLFSVTRTNKILNIMDERGYLKHVTLARASGDFRSGSWFFSKSSSSQHFPPQHPKLPYTLSEVTSSRALSRQKYTRHPPSLSLRGFFIAFSYFSSIRLSRFQIHRHKSFPLLCTYLCKSPTLAFTLLNRKTNTMEKVNNRKLIK